MKFTLVIVVMVWLAANTEANIVPKAEKSPFLFENEIKQLVETIRGMLSDDIVLENIVVPALDTDNFGLNLTIQTLHILNVNKFELVKGTVGLIPPKLTLQLKLADASLEGDYSASVRVGDDVSDTTGSLSGNIQGLEVGIEAGLDILNLKLTSLVPSIKIGDATVTVKNSNADLEKTIQDAIDTNLPVIIETINNLSKDELKEIGEMIKDLINGLLSGRKIY